MAIWAEPQDVLSRWLGGGTPSADSPQLVTLIEDAEDAILEIFPSLPARIASNEITKARVVRVVAGVVIRAWKTGQEFRASYSETTGPFAHSASYNQGGKFVFLTDDEIKTLSPDRTARAFTISMAPRARSRTPWWNGGVDD